MYNHNELGGEPLPPHQVIKAALSAELISADDLVNRGVRVEQIGRSHSVYRLLVGEKDFAFIKSFGPSRGETDGRIEREYAIAELAKSDSRVASLTAPLIKWKNTHATDAVIATKALTGVAAWSVDEHGGGTKTQGQAWTELVHAISQPLAEFHFATRDIAANKAQGVPAFAAQTPWVLKIFSGDANADLWNTPSLSPLLRSATSNEVLIRGVRQARAAWRELCLVHGDLKHDNILIRENSVAIIDWEMARVGDPAWDLAGLSARLLTLSDAEDCWSDDLISMLAMLLRQYCQQSRLPAQALSKRFIAYTGAWQLMCALQHQSTKSVAAAQNDAQGFIRKASQTFQHLDDINLTLLEKLT